MRVRHPPGRAGRVWLRALADTAGRATQLLQQKERVLLREQRRVRVLVRETEASWNEACEEARVWLARATALGGRRAVSLVAQPGTASVELQWQSSMGAYYPSVATCRLPPERPADDRPGIAAMTESTRASRAALERAVSHAAARRAADEIDREIVATRRRLRMLEHRWLPALHASLHDLEMSLEEQERDDLLHARWAQARGATEA